MPQLTSKLVEIDRNDLARLRDLFKRDWPQHRMSFFTIDNYCKWYEREDRIDGVGVFSLNGDWESDGTYFVLDGLDLYFHTLSNNLDKVVEGLLSFEPDKGICPCEYEMSMEPAVVRFLQARNLNWKLEKSSNVMLPNEKALQFEINCPEGISLKPVSLKHSKEINDLWPHGYPGSEELIRRLIRLNPSVGAYNDQGELLAWCLKTPIGTIGVLQVKEEHTRRGIASAVVKQMSKKVAADGGDVFASIVVDNEASLKLFAKLGFVEVNELGWVSVPC